MNRFGLLCYLSLGLDITSVNALTALFIAYDWLTKYRKHLINVRQHRWALYHVPNELRTPEICLAAVQHYGYELLYVPNEPNNRIMTPELCLVAVRHDAWALYFVPNELRTLEICVAAVQHNRVALQYVPTNMQEEVRRIADID